MSLYNMLFGRNPNADFLLSMLGYTQADCGRFRDCYVAEDDAGEKRIVIYTRNGGGNREEYQDVMDMMSENPNYICDADDDFDCTYASIEFKVPEKFKDTIEVLYADQDKREPRDKWSHILEGLKNKDVQDPEVARALQVGSNILGKIDEVMAQGSNAGVVIVDGNTEGEMK